MDTFVFVDIKYTNAAEPQLLSIAFVQGGPGPRYLYLELDLDSDAGRQRRDAASAFVRKNALSQWGRVDQQCTLDGIGARANQWLLDVAARTSDVVYFACDGQVVAGLFPLLVQASVERPEIDERLGAESLEPLLNKRLFRAARASSLARTRRSEGIDEHHALAEARALHDGYWAVR